MKKTTAKTLIFLILCFTIVTACTLCLSKPAEPSNIEIYGAEDLETIQEFLSTYPIVNPVSASENGCFVLVHGTVEGDSKKAWDTFYSNVKNGHEAAILIVQYTIEGDPILTYVSFKNDSFFSVTDISRDAWGGSESYYFGSYKFLTRLERERLPTFILSDFDYKTWEEYENDTETNHEKTTHLFSSWDV